MPRVALLLLVSLSACDHAQPYGEEGERGEFEAGLSDLSHKPGDPRGLAPPRDKGAPLPEPLAAIPTPIGEAYCEIVVEGVARATETDYLPHVITCENGGAKLEALKAQAIAARSVAYYAMINDGQICDGQGCQVYSCGAQPQQIHYDAVAATSGQYLSYNDWLTYAFYVAGDNQQPASCIDTDNGNVAGTEQYVTFNEGKTVYDVEQTDLGFVFPEDLNSNGYGQNRGCMSQWGARCLENTKGYGVTDIMRFYYGADIEILQAEGACVVKPNQPATGTLDAVDCATGIAGWAWDADHADTPVDAIVSFMAPQGDANAIEVTVSANEHREDLCQAIGSCAHGLSLPLPRSLLDGASHPLYVYGVDVDGDGPAQLDGSPMQFACAPPPVPPGVRRHVPSPEALTAWSLSTFWQLTKLDDAALTAIPEWQAIAAAPMLVQVAGDPTLWLVDAGFRRRIASAEVAAAWQFDPATAQTIPAADLMAMPQGTDVWPAPYLVQGTGPAIYMLDDPQCPPGGDPNDPLCPTAPGTDGDTGSGTGSGGEDPSGDVPTTDGSPGSGDEPTSSSSGGPVDSASGGALPPGYGQDEGCRLAGAANGGLAPGLWLLALAGARRRRRSA
ncbi:SpoIID/LytB domain-containing protein [Nannocystis radixulma]|uniref:SpoIID/LytB domain-containing protein n=1 Tax=Nannocystis radixulma TaxID=2995305 RepID=A0ABT5B2N7_9BACT|nr:SpoIID/LytB domain-containing protein [Nannocystis radixulma]MDC0667402.1 SpoIID/LytB domain-containing protein [Nannocystis radixulma]